MSGRIDKQIAAEMEISLGTVRVYWKRIRSKVGGTRSEVIAQLARTSMKLDYDGQKGKAEHLEKELEASLVREKALSVYESVFAIYPTPLAILDTPAGNVLIANEAFAEVHGYEDGELDGSPSAPLMAPEDVRSFEKQTRAAGLGRQIEIPTTRVRKDGTTFTGTARLTCGDGSWLLGIKE